MKVSYLKKFLAITLIFVMQFQSVHASVAVGSWSLNLTRVENSTNIFTAFKNGFQSTVAISPSSAQVAKSLLRGGLVGLALSAVTQALLDGIDFVMDSAKQELRYKTKTQIKSATFQGKVYYSAKDICTAYQKVMLPSEDVLIDADENYFDCWYLKPNGTYDSTAFMWGYTNDKTIPLTTLATQIINLAEQGNPDAKAYITSVVQDMLEHDEEYRKSLEAQLDAKLKEATQTKKPNDDCPSGKRNDHGDCWACPLESFAPIRGRVNYAKAVTGGLGKCYKSMNSSQLLTRYKAYSELGTARDAENKCWRPTDEEHIRQANEAKDISRECNQFLGLLGK